MTRFKCRILTLLSVGFIALVVLVVLPSSRAHAGEMTDWAATLKPYVSAFRTKDLAIAGWPREVYGRKPGFSVQ